MIGNDINNIIQDSIYWDIVNWSKAIVFWESILKCVPNNAKVLELGCGANGGLSLWLASKGYNVICSDHIEITDETKNIHKQYHLENRIEYKIIDALSIPYSDYFDIICFKSVLGGIVRNNNLEVAEQVILQIQKALKLGGVLLFTENLSSSLLHKLLRGRYGALKNNWRYFTTAEIKELFSKFNSFNYKTFGFTGCFGRNENQRRFFGRIDSEVFDKILPENLNYIISGIAEK